MVKWTPPLSFSQNSVLVSISLGIVGLLNEKNSNSIASVPDRALDFSQAYVLPQYRVHKFIDPLSLLHAFKDRAVLLVNEARD